MLTMVGRFWSYGSTTASTETLSEHYETWLFGLICKPLAVLSLWNERNNASQVSLYVDATLTSLLTCPYTDSSFGPHRSTYFDASYIFTWKEIRLNYFILILTCFYHCLCLLGSTRWHSSPTRPLQPYELQEVAGRWAGLKHFWVAGIFVSLVSRQASRYCFIPACLSEAHKCSVNTYSILSMQGAVVER